MWNTKKYAAMAVVGAGLAFAATPASACGAYGYAMYHRPYYGYAYAAYRPRYYYRPYAYASHFPMYRFYRPAYAYAGYFPRVYRPTYAYAGYFPRVYRPVFAAYRPYYRPFAFGCAC